jgi:hypothetical protein
VAAVAYHHCTVHWYAEELRYWKQRTKALNTRLNGEGGLEEYVCYLQTRIEAVAAERDEFDHIIGMWKAQAEALADERDRFQATVKSTRRPSPPKCSSKSRCVGPQPSSRSVVTPSTNFHFDHRQRLAGGGFRFAAGWTPIGGPGYAQLPGPRRVVSSLPHSTPLVRSLRARFHPMPPG